jgi:hypothetical protein
LTPAITNTLTRTPTAGATTSTPTPTLGVSPTRTVTPAISPTRTMTGTPTSGASPTRIPTATATIGIGLCSPTSTITVPFTFDGAGSFCWQAANLGAYANSWNLASLTINNVNYSNVYVASGSYPAKINGFYYVAYNSTVTFGHFETK